MTKTLWLTDIEGYETHEVTVPRAATPALLANGFRGWSWCDGRGAKEVGEHVAEVAGGVEGLDRLRDWAEAVVAQAPLSTVGVE